MFKLSYREDVLDTLFNKMSSKNLSKYNLIYEIRRDVLLYTNYILSHKKYKLRLSISNITALFDILCSREVSLLLKTLNKIKNLKSFLSNNHVIDKLNDIITRDRDDKDNDLFYDNIFKLLSFLLDRGYDFPLDIFYCNRTNNYVKVLKRNKLIDDII